MTETKKRRRLTNSVREEMRRTVMADAPSAGDRRMISRLPPGFLTRGLLRKALNISLRDLEYLENEGVIKVAMIDEQTGWRLYHQSTVDEMMNRRKKAVPVLEQRAGPVQSTFSDEQAKQIFTLLNERCSLTDIVIRCGYHPAIVRSIAAEYAAFSGTIILWKEVTEKINELPINGVLPLVDAEGVFDILKQYANATCTACKKRTPASTCLPCTREKIVRAAQQQIEANGSGATNGSSERSARHEQHEKLPHQGA